MEIPQLNRRAFSAYLIGTVFSTGAIVMLIEIAGARVIAPLFGSSIFVWTAVISVTLLSLALGYFKGGSLADRTATPHILYRAILIAGAYLFLSFFIKKATLSASAQLGIQAGALVSGFILFAPPLFLLGMVSPLAVRLYATHIEKVGSRVGVLYFFSTIGSFLGTLLAGFVLIPQFGVSKILLFAAGFLVAVSLFYFAFFLKNLKYLFLLAIAGASVFLFSREGLSTVDLGNIHIKELYKTDSFYGRLKVIEINGLNRFLLIDGANQGGVNIQNGLSVVLYTYVLEMLAYMACPDMKRALVIGLGPGTIPNDFSRKGIVTDVVDIDPQIVGIYRRYFSGYGAAGHIALFTDDGRCFIRRNPGAYDAVILDVLLGDSSPWHLLTVEAFSDIKAALRGHGVLVINFIGLPQEKHSAKIIQAIQKTLAQVFPCVSLFNGGGILGDKAQNVFFLAHLGDPLPDVSLGNQLVPGQFVDDLKDILQDKNEQVAQGAFVLTDDYNPLDFYNAKARELWRRNIMQSADKYIALE
ncbi:MAG TPA: fused MFS/spermidine synthase [Patescibacteria group bacterium]|nr:fused MFS/spermidine synthase [Patescibacteria group bacterium]